jgi:hypothetical protein
MASLIEMNGGAPQKQPRWVPIFMDRSFTGLFTQRAALHDPSDPYTARYYGGRPDALWMGSNIELTNRLTLQRRPGLSQLSTAIYPNVILRTYSFQLTDGTIQLIVDMGPSFYNGITSVTNNGDGTATYFGPFTFGVGNAYVGLKFLFAGMISPSNNGTFPVTASTATSLTVANGAAITESENPVATIGYTWGAVYWDHQDGTKTLLFAKGVDQNQTFLQTYFQGVAGTLYAGDGIETWKYTPGNANGLVWNWGIVAPAQQPSVTIVSSGSAAVAWVASTVWSTMGLIYDTTKTPHTIQQMISVNATGTNTSQLGTTGPGQPPWPGIGGTIVDGSVTWTNRGPIGLWMAKTVYQRGNVGGTATSSCIIYDPGTKACYYNANSSSAGTSGTNPPIFKPGPGQITQDGGIRWAYLGSSGLPGQWKSNHVYATESATNADISSVSEPVSLAHGLPTNQTVYWMVVTTGGTSQASPYTPPFLTVPGQITTDGDLIWMCISNDTWVANTQYSQWVANGTPFSAIFDGTNFQVCIQSGQSGGSTPSWSTGYGNTTSDGTVIWTCVGAGMQWAASTQWFLPTTGFSPPSSSSPYGGAAVIDSNGKIEFVISSGKGGSSPPSWSTTSGGTLAASSTTDAAATWYNLEPATTQSLAWSIGLVYAYSFKARALDDFYSLNVPGTGSPPVPPGLSNPLPAPTGSLTNAISTASPVFVINGANAGAVNTISGLGSTDPQVDTIVIWRSADGGGAGQMFELTEIPAPKPIGGIAQPWTFKDFLPSLPTNLYPGLNTSIPAPIALSNNPPDASFRPMVYNFQRIWGADGEFVPFSGGPDVKTGNPNEAFAPADSLPFLAPVVRLVKSAQGIVTFLTNSIEVIAGGPQTSSFFSVTWAPGIGLLSYNALDVLAGEMYFFSADNQFRIMTPSLNVMNAGFALGDQFANLPTSGVSDTTWNPANVYVASHQNGIDNCIFVADGATGWYRLNPRQVPGATQGPEPIWSPYASITSGCRMVQSVETTPGIKKLLVGSASQGRPILYRNLSIFTDNGTAYDAYFVMGSITLAHPGTLALLKFMEFDFSGVPVAGVGFRPTVSYLLNEISGTFVPFTANPIFDPPSLYGTTLSPTSYSPSRYYFLGNASLARCRHLQLKVDYGVTSNGDEMYTATIFGRVMVEA